MIESLADEPARGEKNAWGVGWERVEFRDEHGTLLPRHPPMEDERRRNLVTQSYSNSFKVISALSKDQYFAALIERLPDLSGDRGCPLLIGREKPKHLLNPRLPRQLDMLRA